MRKPWLLGILLLALLPQPSVKGAESPRPVLAARHIREDFTVDGALREAVWRTATPTFIDQVSRDGKVRPELATAVRALWSGRFLYLAFECPFTRLTCFEPVRASGKRYDLNRPGVSLWDRDVVEAFIGADARDPRHYAEFEVAPSNERLDVMVTHLPEKDFAWQSRFESAVTVDRPGKRWICEMRIPLSALADAKPTIGSEWRLNLFRCDRANHAALAWRPTLTGSFHAPERFGGLEFTE